MENYYTLEYSPSQKCFHYDQVSDMIKHNLAICAKNIADQSGYICIGIFKTEHQRDIFRNELGDLFGTAKP